MFLFDFSDVSSTPLTVLRSAVSIKKMTVQSYGEMMK